MPKYTVTHPSTGKKITLTGVSPPSESELDDIFAQTLGVQTTTQDNAFVTSDGKVKTSNPQYRKSMEQFIRSQGKRDLKQELVRGLPMGERIATAAMGTYNDPVHPERTVDAVLGAQTQSATTGGAMLRGVGNLMRNPAPQIEGALAFPADMATGLYKAATSPESGSLAKFGKETVKGIAAPTGLADLVSGDMSFPEARAAWEQNALGSGLMAYGTARGAIGAKNSLKDLGRAGLDKVGVTPEKLYASSLKQSTVIPMEQRAANVKAGLEGGYVPNKKGLDRLYNDINGLNEQISTSIKESTTGGKTVNVDSIISRLDDVKQRAIDSFGDNNNVLAKIEDFATSLRDHPAVKDGEIPIDVAQKMKVNTYKQLKNAYGELKGFEVEAKKAMARGAKEEIVAQIPELAELNAKDSTLINLEKVLFKAVNRIENRDLVGIGVPIKIATGAMGGPKGAIIGALVGLIDTPAIKANLAIAMHKARGKRPTPSELDTTINGIKASLAAKIKDERGLVGKDIGANEKTVYMGATSPVKFKQQPDGRGGLPGVIYASDLPEVANRYAITGGINDRYNPTNPLEINSLINKGRNTQENYSPTVYKHKIKYNKELDLNNMDYQEWQNTIHSSEKKSTPQESFLEWAVKNAKKEVDKISESSFGEKYDDLPIEKDMELAKVLYDKEYERIFDEATNKDLTGELGEDSLALSGESGATAGKMAYFHDLFNQYLKENKYDLLSYKDAEAGGTTYKPLKLKQIARHKK